MSQLSLFDGATGNQSPSNPVAPGGRHARGNVGECVDCGKLLCRCEMETSSNAKPYRRNTDPESSKKAAEEIVVKLGHLQTVLWSGLRMMVEGSGCAECETERKTTVNIELGEAMYTANEIMLYVYQEFEPMTTRESLRRHVKDLVEKRLAVESSIDQVCRYSGREVKGFGINSEVSPRVELKGEK